MKRRAGVGVEQVTLTPSDKIRFTPHPEHDLADLDSIHQLADRVSKQGYHGALLSSTGR